MITLSRSTVHALFVCLCILGARQAHGDDKKDERIPMAIVPPTVRVLSISQGEDAQLNPSQIMDQIIPRVINDSNRRKWPFRILPASTVGSVYQSATGHELKPTDEVPISDLRNIADKVNCRYLVTFRVNELVARYKQEFLGRYILGRANIDLFVYDRETSSFIWKTNQVSQTRHEYNIGNVGLRREQDGALNAALTRALEPFAKGERKSVERVQPNTVVTVQKVLADGKRVLIDTGRSADIQPGDEFSSIESDLRIRITEVLDNGSIADVVSGSPKEKEALKPKKN